MWGCDGAPERRMANVKQKEDRETDQGYSRKERWFKDWGMAIEVCRLFMLMQAQIVQLKSQAQPAQAGQKEIAAWIYMQKFGRLALASGGVIKKGNTRSWLYILQFTAMNVCLQDVLNNCVYCLESRSSAIDVVIINVSSALKFLESLTRSWCFKDTPHRRDHSMRVFFPRLWFFIYPIFIHFVSNVQSVSRYFVSVCLE